MNDQILPGDSILRTKIHIPRLRPQLVVRQRLLDRLQNGLWCRLTLVSAQAGFGKTTLLSDWALKAGLPVAWITLDEDDNIPDRFLRYLHAAIQAALPGFGGTTSAMLAARQPLQPLDFIASLINELDEFGTKTILVLDDYHLLHHPNIHQAINYLLEHLPESLHLVVAGRSDPLLPLPRLRARGEINELRSPDLRFSAEESKTFLHQVMGLDLSNEDIAALETRTEGWIAGLQLAALSMRDRADSSQFIRAFTGSNRYILDYLIEEVLRRQPEEIQDFLIKTSILNRLSDGLCQAVSANPGSRTLLEKLDQANLFIQELDDERGWYRYHTLFADLLRYQLKRSLPDEVTRLHLRAAGWLAANHMPIEAVYHYLEAHEIAQAAFIVEATGEQLLNQGHANRFLGWLDSLPHEVYLARPRLPLIYAWGLISTNQFGLVEPHLQAVEKSLETWRLPETEPGLRNEPKSVLTQVQATRAIAASTRGDLEETIRLSNQALADMTPNENLYSALQMGLGVAYHLHGNLKQATQAFSNAASSAEKSGEIAVWLTALFNTGDLQLVQGMLHQAEVTFKRGIEATASSSPSSLPVSGMAYCGLANLYYEWDDLPAALECSQKAVALSDQWGNSNIQVASYGIRSRILDALGQSQAAADFLARAAGLMESSRVTPNIQQLVDVYQVDSWLRAGQIEHAWQWLQNNPLKVEDDIPYIFQYECFAKARVMVTYGMAHKDNSLIENALTYLQRLHIAMEGAGAKNWMIGCLALLATGLAAIEENDQALGSLQKALSQASREGYIRLFVDYGHPMEVLLERDVALPVTTLPVKQYAAALLTHFEGRSPVVTEPVSARKQHLHPPDPGKGPGKELVEPLSEREIEVLGLVASGLGNQEIAERLILAPGTIKRHLHNIFGKLDVATRSQAIARAHELKLIR